MNENEAQLIQKTSEKASRFFTSLPPPTEKRRSERPHRLTVKLPPPKKMNMVYKKQIERLGHVHEIHTQELVREDSEELTLGRVGMTGVQRASLLKKEDIQENYNRRSLFRK